MSTNIAFFDEKMDVHKEIFAFEAERCFNTKLDLRLQGTFEDLMQHVEKSTYQYIYETLTTFV